MKKKSSQKKRISKKKSHSLPSLIRYYWPFIKNPFYVLLVWSILGLVAIYLDYGLYSILFSSLLGLVISILAFVYIGAMGRKIKGFVHKDAALAAGFCGLFIGFIKAVIGLIIIYTVPEVVQLITSKATAAGANPALVLQTVQAVAFFNIFTSPLFHLILGVVSGLIGFWLGSRK